MADYKTPGVYIKEVNSMSGTISAVETAIPAFIGYTEKAEDGDNNLYLKPTPISSMMEYVGKFGKGFKTQLSLVSSKLVKDVSTVFPMYDSMQMFFRNGGGDCYITSVGTYGKDSNGVEYPNHITAKNKDDFQPGLNALKKYIEPTMVVIPDAVFISNSDSDCFDIQVAIMEHCGNEMRNRVAILDIFGGNKERSLDDDDVITKFRDAINQYVDFGAAYYPWLDTTLFTASSLDYTYISDTYTKGTPDTSGTPDSVIYVQEQCVKGMGITTIPTKTSLYELTKPQEDVLIEISKLNPGWDKLEFFKAASIQDAADNTFQKALVIALYNNPLYNDIIQTISDAENVKVDEKNITKATVSKITLVDAKKILSAFNKLTSGKPTYTLPYNNQLHATLLNVSTGYNDLMTNEVAASLNQLPPSSTMAGIYTYVDNTASVGRAPANYAVSGVNRPSCKVTSKDQEDLNKPVNGKAVNAIRAFKNRGTLVWGARTLDGNSGDWRYINVRRSVIMIETSIKIALEAYVFRPNTLATWIDLETQITAFLTKQWNAGILVGSSQDQAFQVGIGLGTTMTSQDIIDGMMRVSVKLAVTRPAEFIEVTFEQMMPTA